MLAGFQQFPHKLSSFPETFCRKVALKNFATVAGNTCDGVPFW